MRIDQRGKWGARDTGRDLGRARTAGVGFEKHQQLSWTDKVPEGKTMSI